MQRFLEIALFAMLGSTLSFGGEPVGLRESAGGTAWKSDWNVWVINYDDTSLPQLTHFNGRLRPAFQGYNPNVRFRGNPNLESPWHANGGMDRVANLRSRKRITIPRGKWIEVYNQVWPRTATTSTNVSVQTVSWEYPEGTIATELLFSGGKLFLRRTRTKTSSGWIGEETAVGRQPAGIAEVANCQDCHKDVGKQVSQLPGEFLGRDWYGHVRGSDNIFTFRPVDQRGRIIQKYKSFVRWRKDT